MLDPSALFASIPELVRCLAEQTRSRKQLAKLCLVNKTFNIAATPALFRETTLGKRGTESLRAAAASSNLRHVRTLCVENGVNADDYHEIVRQMLPNIPQLKRFRWCDMPLAEETLATLHRACKEIASIHLEFPESMDEKVLGYMADPEFHSPGAYQLEARKTFGRPDLTVFSGLEELVLHGLYGDLQWWRAQIVQVLKISPGLRKLELSLSARRIALYESTGQREKFDDFFDKLCDEYKETGAEPLQLQTLKLGTAMYPWKLASIMKLIDPYYLQDIFIQNKGVYQDLDIILMYDSPGEDSGIAFHAFGPGHCPNLRRFTASNYEIDVHKIFASVDEPALIRQLAMSFSQMGSPQELAALLRPDQNYPSLPLHPRMLDIDLQRDQVYLIDDEDEQLPDDEVPTAVEVLEDLVSGDAGALEGLMVHMAEEPDTPGGFQHLDLLANALTKLVNVTQLGIEKYLFHQTRLSDETLVCGAQILAAAGPRLRYIKVYNHYWSIWRNVEGAIRLDVLEDREISDVELFRENIWVPDTF